MKALSNSNSKNTSQVHEENSQRPSRVFDSPILNDLISTPDGFNEIKQDNGRTSFSSTRQLVGSSISKKVLQEDDEEEKVWDTRYDGSKMSSTSPIKFEDSVNPITKYFSPPSLGSLSSSPIRAADGSVSNSYKYSLSNKWKDAKLALTAVSFARGY